MTSTIFAHFPFPTVREKQKKVLEMIDSAIKSGYMQIFLEAPTGFGKTPVAITLHAILGALIFVQQPKTFRHSIGVTFRLYSM
jgi:Rad3-related DNA helicase